MGPVAAIAIRYIVMAAVQLGIWTALEKYGIPLINYAIEESMTRFGVPRETAQAIMGNSVLQAFEEVGIFAFTLKTKLPIKVAEALGFTSKGFVKRQLSSEVAVKVAASATAKTAAKVATVAEAEKIAEVVSKSRGISLSGVKSLLAIIATIIGVPTGFFFAFAQYIDFANWQGPYQKTFQGLLSKIGINPDSPMPKANTLNPDTWKRIYSTVEELNPQGISFPFSGVDKPYSRLNLADLVDEVAANLIKAGGEATFKNVIALVLPLVQLGGTSSAGSGSSTADLIAKQSFGQTSDVRVFTGIVSQGVLGNGLTFTPRPDDLIENEAELKTAMANNIAPYLSSLLGKIIYEIKVVPSVIVGNLTKKGAAQTIITGYTSTGQPKKKFVVNKFAVADIFIINDTGNRVKIKRIVLGPTDAVKFQPTGSVLAEMGAVVSKDVVTTKIDDISVVVSNTPTISATPTITPTGPGFTTTTPAIQTAQKFIGITAQGQRYEGSGSTPQTFFSDKELNGQAFGIELFDLQSSRQGRQSTNMIVSVVPKGAEASPPAQNPTQGNQPPVQETPVSALPAAALSAQSLKEFYGAIGRQLPSIEERSRMYQSLGLGQAAFYTGTYEQNDILLKTLKLKGV